MVEQSFKTDDTPIGRPITTRRVAGVVSKGIVNLFLVGLLGVTMGAMWLPGYIGANDRPEREWRREPRQRGWWRSPQAPSHTRPPTTSRPLGSEKPQSYPR